MKDVISSHPFTGALPSSVRKLLENSTKETMKLRGVTLYREGSKPNGIWIISNGIVKVNHFFRPARCSNFAGGQCH